MKHPLAEPGCFFSQQMKRRDFGRRKACVAPHVMIYVTCFLQLSKLPLKNLHICNNSTHHLPRHFGLRSLPLAIVQWSWGSSNGVCSCGLKLAEVKLGNGGWGQSSWHDGAICRDSWISLESSNSLLPAAGAAASTASVLLLLFFFFLCLGLRKLSSSSETALLMGL